jgi:hypothetical protein
MKALLEAMYGRGAGGVAAHSQMHESEHFVRWQRHWCSSIRWWHWNPSMVAY